MYVNNMYQSKRIRVKLLLKAQGVSSESHWIWNTAITIPNLW